MSGAFRPRPAPRRRWTGSSLHDNPAEVAKVAKLAEKKGGQTRAILKTLGRGAILLSVASFNLALWILGAIATLFGFVSSAKAGVERITQRHLDRKRAERQTRYAAMVAARA